MLNKFKNFCEKPITWGAYFKLCGTILGIYTAGIAAYLAKYKYDEYKEQQEIAERIKSMKNLAVYPNNKTESE